MTPFSNTNRYNVSLERFVQISNEPELLEFLSNESKLAKREVYDRVEDDRFVSWKVSIDVGEKVPLSLRRVFGNQDLRWVQSFRWDKETNVTKLTLEEGIIERFFDVKASIARSPVQPQVTDLNFTGEIKSKVPLLKKSLESFILDKVMAGWDEDADARRRWIEKHMKELAAEGALSPEETSAWS